ncbi:MAG: endonuclease/exonuclease/phosphatase family protein, partial [Actinobacteria bacterium]|nr:endonuclease/exonuclease/phosphatase family protein [Actinomycetota bacterium]
MNVKTVSPFSFVAHTYNLMGTIRWTERRPALERFFRLHRPDVLCVQELSPEASELIIGTLPEMSRVEDPLDAWTHEGNIFWNVDLFDDVEHGTVDINILEQSRFLFWVRLLVEGTGSTILVASAHFDWIGNTKESTERVNVRVEQAERTVQALDGLAHAEEPVLFMGDLNDDWHPLAVLGEAGFADSFRALGQEPVPTHPAPPMKSGYPPRTHDWMLHRGPIRPLLTAVIDGYVGDLPGSDHRPVATTYRIQASQGLGR